MNKCSHLLVAVFVAPLAVPAAFAYPFELKWQDYEQRGYMSTRSSHLASIELALINNLELLNAAEVPDDKLILCSLERMITVTANRSKFDEALEYNKLAIRYAERVGDGTRLAMLYASKGNLERQTCKFTQAELSYDRALKLHPQKDANRAVLLHGLARVRSEENNLADGQKTFEAAFDLQKQLGESPSPADLLRAAECYAKQGRYKEAETLLNRAQKIDEQELGPGHPVLASELNDLAVLKVAQGDLVGAEKDMKKAVQICRKFGYLDMPDWLNNLQIVLRKQNKMAEADAIKGDIGEFANKKVAEKP